MNLKSTPRLEKVLESLSRDGNEKRLKMPAHLQITMSDSSSIGEARRSAMRLADAVHMDETITSRVSIVTTELATNLVNHATPGTGELLFFSEQLQGASSIEIISIDRGPGMNDIAKCFADGFSTGGTPGNGLGAIRRLSNEIDVHSVAGGTTLWTRLASHIRSTADPLLLQKHQTHATGLSISSPGESECGDTWRIKHNDDGQIAVMIADGLGHGPLAAEASLAASAIFERAPFSDICKIIEQMHVAISATRGAAVAIAQIHPKLQKLTYAGVGNIAGTLLSPDGTSRGLFTHNGTVGHQMRKVQAFEYPWTQQSVLVMHSDGLQTRWNLEKYPGLSKRHPGVIAGVLYRDFKRGKDDLSVVIISPYGCSGSNP